MIRIPVVLLRAEFFLSSLFCCGSPVIRLSSELILRVQTRLFCVCHFDRQYGAWHQFSCHQMFDGSEPPMLVHSRLEKEGGELHCRHFSNDRVP